ncbi:sensor histidine kinase [Cohnella silvisoli]|uniref:Histidine kinase n=1 Tax=Cohnella silvisoli TaxID=2873699 RepID=A0ABV1L4Z7_9BACL|nr:histidine kinase [Cohnella silvisoli]MCD9026120.1 histidine kinase [Cohnella silvisoli]
MIYQKNQEYSVELLDKIAQYIRSQIENVDGVIVNSSFNTDVHQYLKVDNLLDKIELFKRVDLQLAMVSQLKNGVQNMIILGENGNNMNLVSGRSMKQAVMETVADLKKHDHSTIKPLYSGLKKVVDNNMERYYFTVGTNINNINPSYPLGYLIVILDMDSLFPKFETMLENGFGNFYVLDRNGVVCASNELSIIGQKLDLSQYGDESSSDYIIQSTDVEEFQGKVVNIYSKRNLYRGLEQTRAVYLWIFALFIPFLCLLLWVTNRNVLGPIRYFIKFIQIQQVKNIVSEQRRLELKGYHEIVVMADKFNDMLDEIDQLTDEVVSSKTRIIALGLIKKQAELAYLKQQVNPHFLYNILESMKGMASEVGAHDLRGIIVALGKMLRYSIKGQDEVTLAEELEIANSYLMLQQFRFDDRFKTFISIPQKLLNYRVIKMILQPILENAITHGLENRIETGALWVTAEETPNGDVIIRVKDDGLGMTQERLSAICNELESEEDFFDTKKGREHLGILNVHNRLRTAYGPNYGLTITSMPGMGTEVILRLPKKEG